MAGQPYRRDPISVYYDSQAARKLGQAWRRRGSWVDVPVPQLSPRASVACLAAGINPYGSDGHGTNRSVRGFVRSLYHQHRESGAGDALVWEDMGGMLGGWQIRIMRAPHGDPRLPPKRAPFVNPPDSPASAAARDW